MGGHVDDGEEALEHPVSLFHCSTRRGCICISVYLYISILVVSCFFWSGGLDSSDVHLPYNAV